MGDGISKIEKYGVSTDDISEALGVFASTDNDHSSAPSQDYTTEQTIFEIALDTRYEIKGAWIDITPFTNGSNITIQFYRSVSAAGGTYRKSGSAYTVTKNTDNPVVDISDYAHYGYTKVTAISDGGETVEVPFGRIICPME
jgi:hypothetical protein